MEYDEPPCTCTGKPQCNGQCGGAELRLFRYTGLITLTNVHGHQIKVPAVLREDVDHYDATGTRRDPPVHSWWGTAHADGKIPRLPDVLGERVVVGLADGRTGKAHVTGYPQDSMWTIEIQGDGPVPA